MAAVALVPHRRRPAAADLARQAVDWLESRGHEVRLPEEDALAAGLATNHWPVDKLVEGLDLAVSLGGDGTMLHTVDLVAPAGVPVLGVNVGNLGYLTEVEPGGLTGALERFLDGRYSLEARMTLDVEMEGGRAGPGRRTALNEAVVEKVVSGHTIRLAVSVNGDHFLTCAADGLIVATPTGSTAYNLSARGPIVSPAHRAIVVTLVSPHMLFDRSLVLGAEEWVQLEVLDGRPAALTVDGADLGVLGPGSVVTCRVGPHDARFVAFGKRNFHRILRTKFGLAGS